MIALRIVSYLSLPQASAPDGTPVRVLRGLEKVYLEQGESQLVSFPLTRRDMSYWDAMAQDWRLLRGTYTVGLGFSSRDIAEEISLETLS